MRRGKNTTPRLRSSMQSKLYEIAEAVELVKKTSTTKFDATIDVSFSFKS